MVGFEHSSANTRQNMGKQRRQRKKLHSSANKPNENKTKDVSTDTSNPLSFHSSENIFKGLDISIDKLNKLSTENIGSNSPLKEPLPKKQKLKMLKSPNSKRIDIMAQIKQQYEAKKKKIKVSFSEEHKPVVPVSKPKGIQKASRRKKNLIEGVRTFKNLLKNKNVAENPLKAITEHINRVVAESS